jgi:hypothetical protein
MMIARDISIEIEESLAKQLSSKRCLIQEQFNQ